MWEHKLIYDSFFYVAKTAVILERKECISCLHAHPQHYKKKMGLINRSALRKPNTQ